MIEERIAIAFSLLATQASRRSNAVAESDILDDLSNQRQAEDSVVFAGCRVPRSLRFLQGAGPWIDRTAFLGLNPVLFLTKSFN
jgi:hypothetical protein